MSKVQSKELTAFYRTYKAWLDIGAPHMNPYSRFSGLCYNTDGFIGDANALKEELYEQFLEDGLDDDFPFGKKNYRKCSETNTQHLDPLRIKWVEEHLKPKYTGEKE